LLVAFCLSLPARSVQSRVEVKVEEKQTCQVQIRVDLPIEKVAAGYDRVYKALSKSAAIPGFRKGKTPPSVLDSHFGRETVDREVADLLVPEAYREAVAELSLEPYGQPELDVIEFERGKPLSFRALIPLRPVVELGQYVGLDIVRPSIPVTDETVDREIERLRDDHATLVDPGSRGAREGDRLTVEMKAGALVETGGPTRPYVLDIGKNLPEFDSQLIGARPGDDRIVVVKYPDDHEDKELAGKEMTYSVKVLDLKEKRCPELNDAFALEATGAKSVAELREKIRGAQAEQAARVSQDITRSLVVAKVVAGSKIEFPESVVAEDMKDEYARLQAELQRRDSNLTKFFEERPQEARRFEEEAQERVRRRIAAGLALGEVASREDIKVTEDEIEQEIESMAQRHGTAKSVVKEMIERQGGTEQLSAQMLRDKVVDFLVAASHVREEKEPAGDSQQTAVADIG
jgi:trigger factor